MSRAVKENNVSVGLQIVVNRREGLRANTFSLTVYHTPTQTVYHTAHEYDTVGVSQRLILVVCHLLRPSPTGCTLNAQRGLFTWVACMHDAVSLTATNRATVAVEQSAGV